MSNFRRSNVLGLLSKQVDTFKRAMEDPRTPRSAKILGVALLAYLASPIDLIPDFIPVLGQIDDLIIAPVGLYALYRMIPREVWNDAKAKAA